MNPQEFYVEESGTREFVVGEEWPFQYPVSRLGTAITGIDAKVIRLSDGVDVTSTWWPSGSGSVSSGYVVLTAVHMLAVGDYELRMICDVDGVQNRQSRCQFKVYA
jgi:hypothetical protein